MTDDSSHATFIRLPGDLRRWVAGEALRGRCSINAIIVGAVASLKAGQANRRADDRHTAAIEMAITLSRLPKGTEIVLRPSKNERSTEVLVRLPERTRYLLLANVKGEEVLFGDDVNGAEGEGAPQ